MSSEQEPTIVTRVGNEQTGQSDSFSDASKEWLLGHGYLIYLLSGASINELSAEGKAFWSTWHKKYPMMETHSSQIGEVAINPSKLFMEGNGLSLPQQDQLLEAFSTKVSERIEARAILGNVPDYSELFFLHLERKKEDLFKGKYARTCNSAFSNPVYVGGVINNKLGVVYWQPVFDCFDYFTAPLIVPAKK